MTATMCATVRFGVEFVRSFFESFVHRRIFVSFYFSSSVVIRLCKILVCEIIATTSTFAFGASLPSGGIFGQQQQPSSFGTPSSQPSLFGTPAQQQTFPVMFGAQSTASAFPQGQGLFGATTAAPAAGAFGQQATSSPFGQSQSLFGAKPVTTTTAAGIGGFGTSTFGGFGGLGATSQPSIFGTAQQQPKPMFGTAFGTQQQPQQQPAFGAATSAATGTGLFGGSPFGTGQQSIFGAQQQAKPGLSFGASAVITPTGTTVKFNPKIDTDTMMKNSIHQNIQTKHQCITGMKEYEAKSLEELRTEDYLANRKGPSATQPGLAFGSTLGQTQPQSSIFGAASTAGSLFSQQKPLFGGSTAFGTATTTAAGTSLFGQQAQQPSTGLFGSPTTKPLFGATTTTTSTFTFSTPASTGGIFGQQQQQPSLFGTPASQPSMFGAPAQPQAAAPMFGAPSTQSAFPQGQSIFGAATAAPAAGAFGQPATASPFGQSQGIFGAKPATTAAGAFGGFGASTFGGFGGLGATTQPSMFGAAQQQKPMFGGFGTQQPAFGPATGATAGTGMFGASPFGTGQQSLFAGQQQAKPGLAFGTSTGFGGAPLTFGGGMAGATDPSQAVGIGTDYNTALMQQEVLKSQLMGLSTSPYGDRKVQRGKKTDEEPLPVPTDPLAQRRILDSSRTSSSILGGIATAKPLPPFRPMTRLSFNSPQNRQPEITNAFQGIDSDTLQFTEGFIPKKSIKKLVIKPKGTDGARLSMGDGPATATTRSTAIPENNALTTATRITDRDRTTVRALNFDNTTADNTRIDHLTPVATAESTPSTTAPETSDKDGSTTGRIDADGHDGGLATVDGLTTVAEDARPMEGADSGDQSEVMVDLVVSPDPSTGPAERPSPIGLGGVTQTSQFADDDVVLEDAPYEEEAGKNEYSGRRLENTFKMASPSGVLFTKFLQEVQQPGKMPPYDQEMEIFEALQDYPVELTAQRIKRKPVLMDLHEKSMALLRKPEESTMIELSQHQPEPVSPSPIPSQSAPRHDTALFVVRPKHSLRLVPYDRSIVYNRSSCWLDASAHSGRRFRAGWAVGGALMVKTDRFDTKDTVELGTLFDGRMIRAPEEFTLSMLNVGSSEKPNLADVDGLLKCQSSLSDRFSGQQCNRFVPLDDGEKSINAYLEAASDLNDSRVASSVFQLCKALWGVVKRESREESLSDWLIDQCRKEVDATVESLKRKGKDHYIDAVYCLLTSRRIEEASQLAQKSGDWRLSLTISQMMDGSQAVKQLWLDQLKRWVDTEADRYIDTTRLKIYALAGGMLKWRTSDGRVICAYDGIQNWKLAFGVYLWYGCTSFASISQSLDQYENDWTNSRDELAPAQPLANYDHPDWSMHLDVCYHLLRLFADRSYSIFKVLEPYGWTLDPLDFHLSWHLWCVLDSFGLPIVDRHRLDTLHAQYAFQLERMDMWQRGVFVAMHIENSARREAIVKQLLFQHVGECNEEDKTVLVNGFGVPIEWMMGGNGNVTA